MATTAETLAKELGITPQALRRKLRALNLGHSKGKSWTWEDDSSELAALKQQLRETKPQPKVKKTKTATKKPAKKTAKKPASRKAKS